MASPLAAGAEPVVLESGVSVEFHDLVNEAPTYRLRYVAPQIGEGGLASDDVLSDMEALCSRHALPVLRRAGLAPERIIVTLMEEPVEFGVMMPGVAQFFESYLVQDDLCIWEAF